MIPALISISSVTPESLDSVDQLVAAIRDHGIRKATLVVEPTCSWSQSDLDRLRRWCELGISLAGQWASPDCNRKNAWSCRIQRGLSRLGDGAQDTKHENECTADVSRCADWFQQQRLPTPALFIPSAWAWSRLSVRQLHRLPFRFYQSDKGVIDLNRRCFYPLPSLGFQAQKLRHQLAHKSRNLSSKTTAIITKRPLRVAFSPNDLTLRMHDDVIRLLAKTSYAIDYHELPELASRGSFQGSVVAKENRTQTVAEATGQVRLLD